MRKRRSDHAFGRQLRSCHWEAGETLDALQYLTFLVLNKGKSEYKRVTLDSENYREKREETLQKLARRLAATVARTGKNITLSR
jgi:spoIIIJ-associated protein